LTRRTHRIPVGVAFAFAVLLCAVAPSAVAAEEQEEFLVKVVYFVPKNREPQLRAEQILQNHIRVVRDFYALEMARNGFLVPGTNRGQTFAYEADEHGEPVVHVLRGQYSDSYYRGDIWGRVIRELTAAFPPDRSVILVITETQAIARDGRFLPGNACLGAQWGGSGGRGGVALVTGDALWFLDYIRLADERPYDGLTIPNLNYVPMRQHVTFAWYALNTVGSVASSKQGAVAHELGHAFGLPHCFVDDRNYAGQLMGNGFRGFRGNFGRFEGERVSIFRPQAEMLATTRYFNPGEPLTDPNPPEQDVTVTLQNATCDDRHIRVQITATDDDSGLWRSIAYIRPADSTVASSPFDENGYADYIITSADVPRGGLAAGSHTLRITSMDNQGNRTRTVIWVPVPEKATLQQNLGDGWGNAPASGPTSARLRAAISITATSEGASVVPQVEVRPLTEAFTGEPNFTGSAVLYEGNPVMGYVGIELPDGGYHWRYRLIAGDGQQSCWIVPSSGNPAGLQ
jgi:hypothetical protein